MPNANSFPDGYRGRIRKEDVSRVADYSASTLPVGGPGMLRRRFPQGSTCFPLRLAGVLTQALAKTTMHAQLDPGASVHLDPDAKVGLDPYAQVHIADRPDVPHPGAAQLRPDSAPASKTAVQTNYTVFKNVKFGLGEVVTGYNFSPEGTLPEREYCYYASGVDDQAYVTTPIAANGRFIAHRCIPPAGFEPAKAAAECVWFDGKPTRF